MRASALIAIGLAAGAGSVALTPASVLFAPPPAAADRDGRVWACPMIDWKGPRTPDGTCPVCGMDMAPMTVGELVREQRRRMGIHLATVRSGTAAITVRAAGSVEYDQRLVQVATARVAGRIVKRHEATFGCCQEVVAGDAVVDLDSPEAFAAQSELRTAVRLGDAALIAAQRERFARWGLDAVADAVIAGAAPSATVTIRAPVTGQAWLADTAMVDETLMVGKQVQPGEVLLRIVDPDRLAIVLHVPEARARFVREGARAAIATDDAGELPQIDARVTRVGNEINPEIRTVEVRIHLTGARGLLRPGALVTARIAGVLGRDLRAADPSDPAAHGVFTLVPRDAVLSTGVRDVAWRLDGESPSGEQRFAVAPLWLGPRLETGDGQDWMVVRGGLDPGDRVAARGAFLIDAQAQLAGAPSLMQP